MLNLLYHNLNHYYESKATVTLIIMERTSNFIKSIFLSFAFTAILTSLSFIYPAHAKSSNWEGSQNMQARFLFERDSLPAEQTVFRGVIEIKLQSGWHTYWRSPGDAGLPLQMDWSHSENIKDIQMKWPVPERLVEDTFTTFGYKDNVQIPLEYHLEQASKDTLIKADLSLMICKDICIPENATLALEIKPGDGIISAYKNDIDLAARQLPHPGNLDDLKVENVAIGLDKIVITVSDNRGIDVNADVFVEHPNVIFTKTPRVEFNDDQKITGRFIIDAPDGVTQLGQKIAGQNLVITVENRNRSIEKEFSF